MENLSKKEKALELMKKLDLCQSYLDDFKNNGYVCYFERFAGFGIFKTKNLKQNEKKSKENTNASCTLSRTNF